MPNLADTDTVQTFFKGLLIGDSGTGKTGALAGLVKAGYEVGVLDMDNKLASGILPKLLTPEERRRVSFVSLRDAKVIDKYGLSKLTGGAKAYAAASQYKDKWDDESLPKNWGPNKVFVLDSLTFFGHAALDWAEAKNPSYKDPRLWYGEAQEACETFCAEVTSDNFATNVLIISHVTWTERNDGTTKGYPSSIGKALGPRIPAYFNNLLLAETAASNSGNTAAKRTIRVYPTALIDVKTDVPKWDSPALPQETALATIFKEILGREPGLPPTQ